MAWGWRVHSGRAWEGARVPDRSPFTLNLRQLNKKNACWSYPRPLTRGAKRAASLKSLLKNLNSLKVSIMLFYKSQFLHRSDNLSIIITTIKNKMTDVWVIAVCETIV